MFKNGPPVQCSHAFNFCLSQISVCGHAVVSVTLAIDRIGTCMSMLSLLLSSMWYTVHDSCFQLIELFDLWKWPLYLRSTCNDCVMCTWCWVSRMILELCIPSLIVNFILLTYWYIAVQPHSAPSSLVTCTHSFVMHACGKAVGVHDWPGSVIISEFGNGDAWQQSQSWCQSHAYVHTHIHYSKHGNEFRCVMVLCQLLNIWLSLL